MGYWQTKEGGSQQAEMPSVERRVREPAIKRVVFIFGARSFVSPFVCSFYAHLLVKVAYLVVFLNLKDFINGNIANLMTMISFPH